MGKDEEMIIQKKEKQKHGSMGVRGQSVRFPTSSNRNFMQSQRTQEENSIEHKLLIS